MVQRRREIAGLEEEQETHLPILGARQGQQGLQPATGRAVLGYATDQVMTSPSSNPTQFHERTQTTGNGYLSLMQKLAVPRDH